MVTGIYYVFASGNGGQMNDNCNFDGYANSIYTLTVGECSTKSVRDYNYDTIFVQF